MRLVKPKASSAKFEEVDVVVAGGTEKLSTTDPNIKRCTTSYSNDWWASMSEHFVLCRQFLSLD